MRILLVHTYPKANSGVARHYPYYKNAGCDRIVGITTQGGGCQWPTPDVKEIRPDSYINGPHLPLRLLETIAYGLSQGADEIVIIEWDTVFFKPLPSELPKGFVMNVTGGNIPPWKSTRFFHNPWCMDAETARAVLHIGFPMVASGDIEGGNPDLFIGRITDLLPHIPVHQGVFTNYSRNSLDQPGHIEEAREAYLKGVTCVHGIKTAHELAFITAP